MKKYIFIIGLFLIGFNLHGQVSDWSDQMKEAIITNNLTLQKEAAKNLKSNYSNVAYQYYRLMLMHLPNNAILVTNSINDTYPIKIIQVIDKVRPDINVVSLSLLEDEKYRNEINKKLTLNIQSGDKSEHITALFSSGKTIFVSTTVNNNLWNKSNVYLTGLSVSQDLKNPEQSLNSFVNLLKASTLLALSWDTNDALLCNNILPPLMTLYKYKTYNNQNELKQLIQTIAKKTNQEKKVNDILKKYD